MTHPGVQLDPARPAPISNVDGPLIADRSTRRRRYLAFIARWAGLVLCVLLGVGWWLSCRWTAYFSVTDEGQLGLDQGALLIIHTDDELARKMYPARYAVGNASSTPRSRFTIYQGQDRRSLTWQPMYYRAEIPSVTLTIFIPIWMMIALIIVPTGLLWRAELRAARRRRLVGHCHACGYDRAGLAHGVPCPECGTLL